MTREQTSAMREHAIRERLLIAHTITRGNGEQMISPEFRNDIRYLLDELSAVRAENEKLAKDSQRLDWIDSGPNSVIPAWNGEGAKVGVVAQDGKVMSNAGTVRRKTVREAIDEAREENSPASLTPRAVPTPAVRGDREGDTNG